MTAPRPLPATPRTLPTSSAGIALVLLLVHVACVAPRLAPAAAPSIAGHGRLRLNPNYASPAELELLPRVGPALAAAIVEFRAHSAPRPAFRTLADLDAVPRIGPVTLDALAPWLTFGPHHGGADHEMPDEAAAPPPPPAAEHE